MCFSERYGYKGMKKIQLESIDSELRTSLWNLFSVSFFNKSLDAMHDFYPQTKFVKLLWMNFLKRPIDEIGYYWHDVLEIIKQFIFESQWYEVYDFLEFTVRHYPDTYASREFALACNRIFVKEVSAYRFVDKLITPIVGEVELKELGQALQSPLKAVQIHLKTALKLYSDRKTPDYRNSIKESISAVEAICCIITCQPKAQLGDAIKKVKEIVPIHGALESAFNILYGYTSDEKGIRHKLLEESNVEAEDALFMLLACTAFINYLTTKIGHAGLKLK